MDFLLLLCSKNRNLKELNVFFFCGKHFFQTLSQQINHREVLKYLRGDSHEGHGEVEPLPQASEGDEGLSGEAAGGHLAVRFLVLPWRTLAHKASSKPVDALTAVLADAGYAAA